MALCAHICCNYRGAMWWIKYQSFSYREIYLEVGYYSLNCEIISTTYTDRTNNATLLQWLMKHRPKISLGIIGEFEGAFVTDSTYKLAIHVRPVGKSYCGMTYTYMKLSIYLYLDNDMHMPKLRNNCIKYC